MNWPQMFPPSTSFRKQGVGGQVYQFWVMRPPRLKKKQHRFGFDFLKKIALKKTYCFIEKSKIYFLDFVRFVFHVLSPPNENLYIY